jgi:CRP-like cAMP-binding protein
MPVNPIVAPLLRVPLFSGLKPLQITEIARQAERVRFRPGAIVVRDGDPGDAAYLIVSGEAERIDDPAAPQPVIPGSLIGELAMLVEHTYRATVIARSVVHALRITRTALVAQMQDDPALAQHLARHIEARLQQLAQDLRRVEQMLTPIQPDAPHGASENTTAGLHRRLAPAQRAAG